MNNMEEIWKVIEGYPNYMVSNMGNVKSLGNGKTMKNKLLKPVKNRKGYLQVTLYQQEKRKFYYVHRLVAQHFIPNPQNLPQVNHIDEDKTNNCVSNLEFCTAKYNINYSTRNQRVAEKLSKQVLCVETGIIYPSIHQIERDLGFNNSSITQCCKGRLKTCGGYTWKYV